MMTCTEEKKDETSWSKDALERCGIKDAAEEIDPVEKTFALVHAFLVSCGLGPRRGAPAPDDASWRAGTAQGVFTATYAPPGEGAPDADSKDDGWEVVDDIGSLELRAVKVGPSLMVHVAQGPDRDGAVLSATVSIDAAPGDIAREVEKGITSGIDGCKPREGASGAKSAPAAETAGNQGPESGAPRAVPSAGPPRSLADPRGLGGARPRGGGDRGIGAGPEFGVGRSDVDPFGEFRPGHGGAGIGGGGPGMHVGPDHPGFGADPMGLGHRGGGRGAGAFPPGSVPPGARFDPYGPAGVSGDPDDDHLQPPGMPPMRRGGPRGPRGGMDMGGGFGPGGMGMGGGFGSGGGGLGGFF